MIAKYGREATFQTRQMKVINPAEIAIQKIETKHDQFQQACKTILPKVDHKLIEDLLRQQEDSEATPPMFTIEVIIKKGLDTQEMKDWIWNKAGQMPVVDGTHYRIKHTLTLAMLKEISDPDFVLNISGSYTGPN
jgi:hypothetical protein